MFLHFKNTGKNIIFKISNDRLKNHSWPVDSWNKFEPHEDMWHSFEFTDKDEKKRLYRRFSTGPDLKNNTLFCSKGVLLVSSYMDITKKLWLKRRVIISLKNRIAVQISCDTQNMLAMSRIRKIK